MPDRRINASTSMIRDSTLANGTGLMFILSISFSPHRVARTDGVTGYGYNTGAAWYASIANGGAGGLCAR